MIRLLPFVLAAFKIWMLVDAIRRREPYYWLMIIFFIPGGSLIYFFMVKIQDYDLEGLANRFKRPPSVAQLRARYDRTPSLEELLGLADGLVGAGEHAEAANLFTEALGREADNPDALFGLAEARIGLGDHERAIEALETLIEANRGFREYGAFPLLAHALWESGQRERCLATLRELYESNPRLDHALLLAEYLIKAGNKDDARTLLTAAVEDHKAAPRYVRRGTFRSAWEARRMLKACG